MDQQSEDLMKPCGCPQDESQSEPGLLDPTMLWLQDTVIIAMFHVRQRLLWGAVVLSAVFLLLWTATFLYSAFYYSYMPNPSYVTPVHYYYRTNCESLSSHLCSYPVANISLLVNGKSQAMTFGHPYRISLVLEMPDSPTNRELGMFMIRMSCYSREGKEVTSSAHSSSLLVSASSSRFTMLRYRSSLLRSLGTLLFLPAYLTGVAEQKQLLEVEIFSDYTDSSYASAVGAFIEILSSKVQIYSSQLFIYAHFSGIRYILHHFPLASAIIGVASNFMFLSVLLLLGSLREGSWTSQQNKTRENSLKKERRSYKAQHEDHEDSTAEMNASEDSPVNLLHIRPTDLTQGETCM